MMEQATLATETLIESWVASCFKVFELRPVASSTELCGPLQTALVGEKSPRGDLFQSFQLHVEE